MKQLLSIFLCIVFLSVFAGCQQSQTTFHVIQECVQHNTGDINSTEYTYDDQLRPTSVNVLLNGRFSSRVDYSYSEDGTSRITYETSATLEPRNYETQWEYDHNGNIIQAQVFQGETLLNTNLYTYDAEGRELTIRVFSPDSPYETEVDNTYDNNGNLLTRSTRMGLYQSFEEYSYDEKDQIVEKKQYRSSELALTLDYTWDGNTSKCTVMDGNGNITGTTVTTYDQWGNMLTQESKDRDGNLTSKRWYVYQGEDGTISGEIPAGTISGSIPKQ